MRFDFRSARSIFLSLILSVLIWECAGTGGKTHFQLSENLTSRHVVIDSTLTADSGMEAFIAPYRSELKKTMGVVIGRAAVDLKRGKPEAPLNNFVADLMLKRANRDYPQPVDVAITNVGGLRTNIPAGPITLGKIYEVMPFENELVILEFTGEQMLELGRQIGEVRGECIAGMRLEFTDKKLTRMLIGGKEVDPNRVYRVVTTDYLSSPGRKKLQILGQVPRKFLGVKLRDAILDEVKELQAAGKPVTAKVEGRIVFR